MSDFRTLLIDMGETGQIIGLILRSGEKMMDVTVVKVGSDYAVFRLTDPPQGSALRQPAFPLSEIAGIDTRPCFYDLDTDDEAESDRSDLLGKHIGGEFNDLGDASAAGR